MSITFCEYLRILRDLLIDAIILGDVADDVRRELLSVDADAHPGKDFATGLQIAVKSTIRHIGHCCQLGL